MADITPEFIQTNNLYVRAYRKAAWKCETEEEEFQKRNQILELVLLKFHFSNSISEGVKRNLIGKIIDSIVIPSENLPIDLVGSVVRKIEYLCGLSGVRQAILPEKFLVLIAPDGSGRRSGRAEAYEFVDRTTNACYRPPDTSPVSPGDAGYVEEELEGYAVGGNVSGVAPHAVANVRYAQETGLLVSEARPTVQFVHVQTPADVQHEVGQFISQQDHTFLATIIFIGHGHLHPVNQRSMLALQYNMYVDDIILIAKEALVNCRKAGKMFPLRVKLVFTQCQSHKYVVDQGLDELMVVTFTSAAHPVTTYYTSGHNHHVELREYAEVCNSRLCERQDGRI